jgi:hypothetical protein
MHLSLWTMLQIIQLIDAATPMSASDMVVNTFFLAAMIPLNDGITWLINLFNYRKNCWNFALIVQHQIQSCDQSQLRSARSTSYFAAAKLIEQHLTLFGQHRQVLTLMRASCTFCSANN